MLKHLAVQDFALVKALALDLESGLTVITGESGAGKSILLAALSLVLGERASADLVRPGARRAEVHAEFDITALSACSALMQQYEVEDEDHPELCLIRRTVSSDGRSRAFINNVPVTLQVLRELTAALVDLHGQHENLRLAEHHVQLGLLDDFAGSTAQANQVADIYRTLQHKQKEAAALETLISRDTDRAELLRYQLEELATLDLQPGELDRLEAEHRRLSKVDAYLDATQATVTEIEALDTLRGATRKLDEIDDDHSALTSAQETLTGALDLLEDARSELRRYTEQLEPNPTRLAEVDHRLSDIHQLARKHQTPPTVLAEYAQSLQAELDGMAADTSALDALSAEIEALEADFDKQSASLSKKRKRASTKFCKALNATIQQLALPQASVEGQFDTVRSERGTDRFELLVTTNPKYPPGPLGKIASGGELARISLAVQITAAQTTRLPCLVLDEADVGVGGTTADTIGRLLRGLGQTTQILCVTHAPQVAALGNQHLKVLKTKSQDTHIEPLDDEARLEEVARMLAGADVSDQARGYAATLLAEA